MIEEVSNISDNYLTRPNDFVLYNIASPYNEPINYFRADNQDDIEPFDDVIDSYKPILDNFNKGK